MKKAHIQMAPGGVDFLQAATLAAGLALADAAITQPVLIAWCDRSSGRMSPFTDGADPQARWQNYASGHGGRLEVEVGARFVFVYAESCQRDGESAGGAGAGGPAGEAGT